MKGRQRGLALISVLLVMSLLLLITGSLLRNHRLLLQGSGQHLQQLQLSQVSRAAESAALLRLQDALQAQAPAIDLSQNWGPGVVGDEAQIEVSVEDLAGRFNLNALLLPGQIDQVTLARWSRLLASLDLPHRPLAQVGALRELSQVRLLPGIDGHWLRQLEPWVALLPVDAVLNINTAPARLLRTLEGVDEGLAKALIQHRMTSPWPSAQAFTADPLLSGTGQSSHGLGVRSRWYRITVHVALGPSRQRLATDVEHDPKTGQLRILQRRLLPLTANEITP